MSEKHAQFGREMQAHIYAIQATCKKWRCPDLAKHVTILLQDPMNDDMSFILSNGPFEDIHALLIHLEREGIYNDG